MVLDKDGHHIDSKNKINILIFLIYKYKSHHLQK